MSLLDAFFNKGFKAAKCKTFLKLTIPRIKLLRNRREIQIKQMRRDIAKLLETCRSFEFLALRRCCNFCYFYHMPGRYTKSYEGFLEIPATKASSTAFLGRCSLCYVWVG